RDHDKRDGDDCFPLVDQQAEQVAQIDLVAVVVGGAGVRIEMASRCDVSAHPVFSTSSVPCCVPIRRQAAGAPRLSQSFSLSMKFCVCHNVCTVGRISETRRFQRARPVLATNTTSCGCIWNCGASSIVCGDCASSQ